MLDVVVEEGEDVEGDDPDAFLLAPPLHDDVLSSLLMPETLDEEEMLVKQVAQAPLAIAIESLQDDPMLVMESEQGDLLLQLLPDSPTTEALMPDACEEIELAYWSAQDDPLTDSGHVSDTSCYSCSTDPSTFECQQEPIDVKQTECAPSALELRRQKNRDSMRRSRQRQRERIDQMKISLAHLEKQYDALCHQDPSIPAVRVQNAECQRLQSQLTDAVEAARRLGAENLYLKAMLQEQAQWKQHIQRVLESPTAIEVALANETEELEAQVAMGSFGFKTLSEPKVHDVIVDTSHCIRAIHAHLLTPSISIPVPAMPDTVSLASTAEDEAFSVLGWDIHRHLEGNEMEFVFTKQFEHVSAYDIMQLTWEKDLNFEDSYALKSNATQRLNLLQRVNPHAVVMGRDVRQSDEHCVYRTIFLRFCMEMEPCTLPSSEYKHGYVIGTQSLNPIDDSCSCFSPLLEADEDEKLVWADMTCWMEFLTFADDPGHCEVRWTGKTNYKSHQHAYRSAADTLMGLLRWEEHTIAPVLCIAH